MARQLKKEVAIEIGFHFNFGKTNDLLFPFSSCSYHSLI